MIQTGKSVEQPLRTRAMVCNIKLLNPDYDYLFLDDRDVEDFVIANSPDTERFLILSSFVFSATISSRYLAVYRYGGFYFDLDVLLAESLSSLSSGQRLRFSIRGANAQPFPAKHA